MISIVRFQAKGLKKLEKTYLVLLFNLKKNVMWERVQICRIDVLLNVHKFAAQFYAIFWVN